MNFCLKCLDYEAYMEALDNLEGLTPEELELVLNQAAKEMGQGERMKKYNSKFNY